MPITHPTTLLNSVYLCMCSFWSCLQIEKTQSIEKQLKAQLVRVLRKRCADCFNYSSAFLRQGMFLCRGNPTMATYRSTLVNPFPIASATQLVAIIQSWVSTSPSLVLDGLLVAVNPDCPTCIDCLDADECAFDTGSDPDINERISQVLSICAVRQLGQEICTI